jgi:hypothetical protein
MVTRIIPALLLIAVAAPAAAQNEAALKSYFEGKRITVRLDMPGDADGVDVHADARIALDYGKYKDKLKRYGTAIHSGDTVVVTLVKVKKDLIEFQLGGGGFGTFGDDTSTSANIPLIEKSSRERELEKRIKDEDDRDRRHRLDVGSALAEYVDFGERPAARPPAFPPMGDVSEVRKGLSRAELERLFGTPASSAERREGGLLVTTLVFDVGDQRVSAELVGEVLIRYLIMSR